MIKKPRAARARKPGYAVSGGWNTPVATGLLVLADGTVIEGQGFGAEGDAVGEVCFNTAMTGYQEILTDPSYASQIITFTFPHIGNVGANDDDIETANLAAATAAVGCVIKTPVTEPANYRSTRHFDKWLKARGSWASAASIQGHSLHIRDKACPRRRRPQCQGQVRREEVASHGQVLGRPRRPRSRQGCLADPAHGVGRKEWDWRRATPPRAASIKSWPLTTA
jgi:hypothetical protein